MAANLEKRQLDFEWIPGVESLRAKAIKKNKNRAQIAKINVQPYIMKNISLHSYIKCRLDKI